MGDTAADYRSRQRLLAKVLNNSTTRSNVFFVFIQIDYFEAKEVDIGAGKSVVRIGGKLANSPAHRGFFVVDRSKALESIEPGDLPAVDGNGNISTFSFNQLFDWQSLILHRQRIQ